MKDSLELLAMARALAVLLLVQAAIRWVAAARPQTSALGANLPRMRENSDLAFDMKCSRETTEVWAEYAQYQEIALAVPDVDRRMIVWQCAPRGCGGIGNMLRGMSVALYTAMLTHRALYLQPPAGRDGWPEPNRIDWRLPEGTSLQQCQSIKRMCARGKCDWEEVLVDETPCLLLQTNSVPSQWWDEVEESMPQSLVDLKRAMDGSDFVCGCALRFLFDFSKMKRELEESRGDEGLSASKRYVVVHMRMGDAFMDGYAQPVAADYERMRAALTCAQELGRNLSSSGLPFDVFFASDSSKMRQLAIGVGTELDIRVVEHSFAPAHAQWCCEQMSMKLLGDLKHFIGLTPTCHGYCPGSFHAWGDFLALLNANGLVSAGNPTGSVGAGGPLETKGVSDYSQIPLQYNFVPYSNQRRVSLPGEPNAEKGSCVEVTPTDTRVIV